MIDALFYFLIVSLWGTTWLAVKWQLHDAPAEVSVLYRFALAFLVLFVFCKIKKLSLSFKLKEHLILLLLGICIFSVHVLLFYNAGFYLVSGCVSVLFSFVSVFNLVNAAVFLKRKPSSKMLLGALLGLGGLSAFFWEDLRSLSFDNGAAMGILYGLVGSCLFSWGNIVSRRYQHEKMELIPSSTVAMGYGAIVLLLYCLLRNSAFVLPEKPSYWGILLYLAVVSVVGFVGFLRLVSRIGPERAGYATVLFPIIALFLSSLFENYTFTRLHFVGIGCVIGGNILMIPVRKKVVITSTVQGDS